MLRSSFRPVVALVLLLVASPVWAAESGEPVAPSAAVAAEWAKEAAQQGPSSKALNALYGGYGVLQTLDMASTIQARNRGAREVNPLMAGGYGEAAAVKVLMAAVTMVAIKKLEKKNRKAAFVTMVALNVATAVVVVNNVKNAQKLNQR
jgi:F0F1-type ATP synthase assembly protein I